MDDVGDGGAGGQEREGKENGPSRLSAEALAEGHGGCGVDAEMLGSDAGEVDDREGPADSPASVAASGSTGQNKTKKIRKNAKQTANGRRKAMVGRLKPGSCVHVLVEDGMLLPVMISGKIRKTGLVRCMWFYQKSDILQTLQDASWIHPRELFHSTHFDVVPVDSIVHELKLLYCNRPGHPSLHTELTDRMFFCRRPKLVYDPACARFQLRAGKADDMATPSCSCRRPPSLEPMIKCISQKSKDCPRLFHTDCLTSMTRNPACSFVCAACLAWQLARDDDASETTGETKTVARYSPISGASTISASRRADGLPSNLSTVFRSPTGTTVSSDCSRVEGTTPALSSASPMEHGLLGFGTPDTMPTPHHDSPPLIISAQADSDDEESSDSFGVLRCFCFHRCPKCVFFAASTTYLHCPHPPLVCPDAAGEYRHGSITVIPPEVSASWKMDLLASVADAL